MRLILLLFVTICFSQSKQSFYFDFNKSTFNELQENDFRSWLAANPYVEILKIEGFCDYVGSNSYNKKLASNRINHVLKKCKALQVDLKKIEIKPYGEDFEQDSIQDVNRRVDVYFTSNQGLDTFVSKNSKGNKMVLKNLNFYNNSGEVLPESKPVLDELLTVMKKYPKLKIEIQGHICCQSLIEADKIQDIAKVRALAVYVFLINNGISEERLSYKSFKSRNPIYAIPEKSEEQRIANRRVEIMIIEN